MEQIPLSSSLQQAMHKDLKSIVNIGNCTKLMVKTPTSPTWYGRSNVYLFLDSIVLIQNALVARGLLLLLDTIGKTDDKIRYNSLQLVAFSRLHSDISSNCSSSPREVPAHKIPDVPQPGRFSVALILEQQKKTHYENQGATRTDMW